VSQISNGPSPLSTSEALGMLRTAMGYLAAADAAAMAAETQAQCLHALEQVNAMGTAARASILGAFTSGKGYSADGDYSPRSWLIHKTGITKGAAMAHTAWVRRMAAHPQVAAALAAGELSESYARTICEWTVRLPADCRQAADDILLAAARSGLALRDLAELAAELYARSLPSPPGDEPEGRYEERAVKLETTFDGAGVIAGDLTPECAAVVATVLDALAAPRGADDDRTHAQRYHDALHEAMHRLVTAGLVPDRAGQPAQVWAHVSLADLLALDADSALLNEWIARVRAQWAARRAGASVGGSDGAAWLDGDAALGFACDASVTPVVTGDVNYGALDGLVRLCLELARLDAADSGDAPEAGGTPEGGSAPRHLPGVADSLTTPARSGTVSREALEQAIIGMAVDLVSGPGGLASFLRRRQLGARLGGPSLPLDIGYSETIPAGIRKAVMLRDGHCRWPGGCDQPAAACQVHHVKHKANGGETSVRTCVLLCWHHHQVVIHRHGWSVVVNPDGTTTAWSPDRTRVLHSHGPPLRSG
jgi:hypothetical protein